MGGANGWAVALFGMERASFNFTVAGVRVREQGVDGESGFSPLVIFGGPAVGLFERGVAVGGGKVGVVALLTPVARRARARCWIGVRLATVGIALCPRSGR